MSLHSKFIIHWTDRKFFDIDDEEERRREYVERLRNTCEYGFYMKRADEDEEFHGVAGTVIKANVVRVCFSEIRPRQARSHAAEYGKLGIGVDRSFITEREGNPVLYVQCGATGHIVENFAHVLKKAEQLTRPNGPLEPKELLLPIQHIVCGYLKSMSDRDCGAFKHFEEMEWRVVLVDRLVGKFFFEDEHTPGVYRLRVSPADIRIIVFPDDATRRMASGFLQEYFARDRPIVTTLDECEEL